MKRGDSSANSFSDLTFSMSDQMGGAIVSVLQEPILILKEDFTVQVANPAFYQHFQVEAGETIGCKVYELGNGQWNIPELRQLLEDVVKNNAVVREYRVDHEFEQLGRRVILVSANPLHPQSGETSIVVELHDNTEADLGKAYSEMVVDALRDPFVILDWDLRVKQANQPFYQRFQVDPSETEGRLIYELGNGQWDIPLLRELLEEILPKNSSFDDFEVEHDFEDIGHCVMLLNARRIDHIKLIILVFEDVTDQRRKDARQKLLLGEWQHRVKNLLMNVRTLSQLTLEGASSLEIFAESFNGRLEAMARTQDLLVQGSEDTARLDQIVRFELLAIGAKEGSSFHLHGPAVQISARAAHALAMMAHELATNAAKHGALSQRAVNGRVAISWGVSPAEGKKMRLQFRWREHGLSAPPVHTRSGFGKQIVESSLPYLFGGTSKLNFHADGIECLMDVALPSEELTNEGLNRE